jgi:predicted lipid-binding transport protein (Tim44 family)
MRTTNPTTLLLAGLLVGLIGSFTNDLLGGAAAVQVLQVALWVASAALIAAGALGSLRAQERAPRRTPLRA